MVGDMANDGGVSAHQLAVGAGDLRGSGAAPEPLARPFSLGEPLDDIAGHPDLDGAHRRWAALAGEPDAASRRGPRPPLSGLGSRMLLRHRVVRQHHAMLSELTRVVDALAQRCDELNRRLMLMHEQAEEMYGVLSEYLSRVTALLATRVPDESSGGG